MTTTPVDFKYSPRTAPGQLWLLVEYSSGDSNHNYTVIDANDVIGYTDTENMHTGKSIYIRRGKITLKATIVIISDDKEFVNAELQQIKYLAMNSDNRIKRVTVENDVMDICDNNDMHKRRRISGDIRDKSPNWTDSGTVTTTATTTTTLTKPATTNLIPPMTFDQQTQTDSKNFTNMNSNEYINGVQFMQLRDVFINEIRSIKVENRQRIDEICTKINSMQKVITNLSNKLDVLCQNVELKTNDTIEYKIINTTDQDITFEAIDRKNSGGYDSGSTPSPRGPQLDNSVQIHNNTSSNNATLNNNSNTNGGTDSETLEMIKADWSELETNDGLIAIGTNRTLIPIHVLESINWKSPSAATRKLLTTVFSRETLSTHTLTGKPSPAFHDREKPLKNQLDPIKVADIIQIVSKYCKVPETMVRCAITTKCADENKMSRQRKEKKRRSLVEQNKENISYIQIN